MKTVKRPAVLTFVLFHCLLAFGNPQAKPKASAPPSLDLLVARVEGYWKLLSKGNRSQASAYVAPRDREKFVGSFTPQFKNPRFKSLEIADNRNEAIVTVMVKRIVPQLTVEMDWPVKERWRFEKGTWYRTHDPHFLRAFGKDPDVIDAAKLEIQKKLSFEENSFNFGKVNQNTNVVLRVKYTLAGTDPIPVTLKSSTGDPDCSSCSREKGISIIAPKDQTLVPGINRELSIEVPTWNYDGAVKEQFTLVAKFNNVDVPLDFSVAGSVYVPLSISPKSVHFKKGEREKEILMRNNSTQDLKLEQALSETRALTIDPFPAVIPPGEQLKFKLKAGEFIDSALPGTVDRMAITFTPLNGFSGISYKVYLNDSEEKKEETVKPLDGIDMQEIIRRKKSSPQNR